MKKIMVLLAFLTVTISGYSQCDYNQVPNTIFYVNGILATPNDSIKVFKKDNVVHDVGSIIITFNRLYNISDIKMSGCNLTDIPLLVLTESFENYTPLYTKFDFRYLNIKNDNSKNQVYTVYINYDYKPNIYKNPYTLHFYLTTANTPYQNGYNDGKSKCGK